MGGACNNPDFCQLADRLRIISLTRSLLLFIMTFTTFWEHIYNQFYFTKVWQHCLPVVWLHEVRLRRDPRRADGERHGVRLWSGRGGQPSWCPGCVSLRWGYRPRGHHLRRGFHHAQGVYLSLFLFHISGILLGRQNYILTLVALWMLGQGKHHVHLKNWLMCRECGKTFDSKVALKTHHGKHNVHLKNCSMHL